MTYLNLTTGWYICSENVLTAAKIPNIYVVLARPLFYLQMTSVLSLANHASTSADGATDSVCAFKRLSIPG